MNANNRSKRPLWPQFWRWVESHTSFRVCGRCECIYFGMRSCPECDFASFHAPYVYCGYMRAYWEYLKQLRVNNRVGLAWFVGIGFVVAMIICMWRGG